MSTQNPTDNKDFLVTLKMLMEGGIKSQLDTIYEENKARIIKTIDDRKSEVIAGVVLDVMKRVDVRQMSDQLIITILKQ